MNMEALFIQVLHNSILASILVAFVLLAKTLLKYKINPTWHYFLWLLIVIRLVMPFDIPIYSNFLNITGLFQNHMSSDSFLDQVIENPSRVVNDEIHLQPYDGTSQGNSVLSEGGMVTSDTSVQSVNKNQSISEAGSSENNVTGDTPSRNNQRWSIQELWSLQTFCILWLLGIVLLSGYTLILNLKFHNRIKQIPRSSDELLEQHLQECKDRMGITQHIDILLTTEEVSPSLIGLFHMKLLLPINLINRFSENELEHIILHELSHYKRKDLLTNWIFVLVQIIHWFNPIVWFAFYQLREECEVVTDAKALSYLEAGDREQYGYTLINLAAYFSRQYWVPAALNFTGGKGPLKRRITMIKLFHKKSFQWSLLALLSVVIIGAIGLTGVKGKENLTDKNSPDLTSAPIESSAISDTKPTSTPTLTNVASNTSAPKTIAKDQTISINGDKKSYQLHSVDFIDATHGWAIREEYDYINNVQTSKLIRTLDGGQHWDELEQTEVDLQKIVFIDENNGWAIALAENELLSDGNQVTYELLNTRDGGESWNLQFEQKALYSEDYDLWFQDTMHGYAAINGSVMVSNDGGTSWTKATFPVKDFHAQRLYFTDAETGWVIGNNAPAKQIDPNNPVAIDRIYVFYTFDGGKSWKQQFKKDYTDGNVSGTDITFVNASTGWFLTSDLSTWEGELYYTSNSGKDWEKVNTVKSVRPVPRELDFVSPTQGFIPLDVGAGPIAGGFLYTNDGGKTLDYTGSETGLSSVRGANFISSQEGWAIGSNINLGDYILHTKDGGKTWSQEYPGTSPTLDISFVDEQHGFGLGSLPDQKALLSSNDGGSTWRSIYLFPENRLPSKISFIDQNNGWVLTTSEEGTGVLLKTTDGGYTWEELKSDIGMSPYYSLQYFKFMDQNNGVIVTFENSKIVIYRTMNGGAEWQITKQEETVGGNLYQFSFVTPDSGWEVSQYGNDNNYKASLTHILNGSDWNGIGELGDKLWTYGMDFINDKRGWLLISSPPFQTDSHMVIKNTIDGGKSWFTYTFPDGVQLDPYSDHMPIQFIDEQNGWILSRLGLLRTQDGGVNWSWIN